MEQFSFLNWLYNAQNGIQMMALYFLKNHKSRPGKHDFLDQLASLPRKTLVTRLVQCRRQSKRSEEH